MDKNKDSDMKLGFKKAEEIYNKLFVLVWKLNHLRHLILPMKIILTML